MRSLSLLAALSALPAAISAFENTSPFFIFSPNRLPPSTLHLTSLPPSTPQTSTTFLSAAHAVIAQCAAEAYVLVHQPSLHATHLQNSHPPHLRNALRRYSGTHIILPFVRNSNSDADTPSVMDTLEHWAQSECNAETISVEANTGTFAPFDDMRPKVLRVEFPSIDERATEEERRQKVREMDVFLFSVLDLLPTDKYAIIFTSSPAPPASVHGDFGSELLDESGNTMDMPSAAAAAGGMPETELKARSPKDNKHDGDDDEKDPKHGDDGETGKLPKNASLFQRYVFFSPAVWMGYTAAFFMLAIVYVALSALGSVKVSYGAFEKEMGPSAAKKQQ